MVACWSAVTQKRDNLPFGFLLEVELYISVPVQLSVRS